MAQKPDISARDTLQFLQEHFYKGAAQLTLLQGGDWSQAYSFVHQGKKYVLRWCHSPETFEKDTAASRFSSEALPVPKVIRAGKQFDTYFAITEFARGKFIDTLTAAELEALLPALFRLFDALRTADLMNTVGYGGWDKDGVGDFASWKDYLLAVKHDDGDNFAHGWYSDLANSSIGTTAFDRLYAQLESLVDSCPEVRELIHSDLLNYNLLVLENHISGVIDWQCSLYGDSLYDVAWFMFYAPWFPQFETVQLAQKLLAHFEALSADNSNLKTRLLCYQLHIGLGSIVYNTFKRDWQAVQENVDYTMKLSGQPSA